MAHTTSRDKLEEMIDRHSVSDILSTIAEICYDKAIHIQQDPQDNNLAQVWARSGQHIDHLTTKIPV